MTRGIYRTAQGLPLRKRVLAVIDIEGGEVSSTWLRDRLGARYDPEVLAAMLSDGTLAVRHVGRRRMVRRKS